MADNNQPIEWYLARDGQQHGPVSDIEFRKIVELGFLRPTDLVWREGMVEWAPAETVVEMKRPAPPAASVTRQPSVTVDANRRQVAQPRREPEPEPVGAPQRSTGATTGGRPAAAQTSAAPISAQQLQRPQGAPGHQGGSPIAGSVTARGPVPAPVRPQREPSPSAVQHDVYSEPERRSFPWRAAAVLVVLAGLAGGGWALYRAGALSELPFLAAPVTSESIPVISRPSQSARDGSAAATAAISTPSAGQEPIDGSLQKSPLWRLLKRDFPEWYDERLGEITRLSGESRSEREIQSATVRAIVDLRRRHHADALAASPERLKAMAVAFIENLAQLSRVSTSACYGYISQGEASAAVADLKSPEHRAAIDAQLATIFEAVADGRKSPTRRDAPRREDYDVLSAELGKRGWSAADLQLFTDARALSRAAPEKVCQMVQDWFAAQLAVQDEAAKLRLLGEALKPVVAG
jgi:hypothetical protein